MQVILPIDKRFKGQVILHHAHEISLVNPQTHRHVELELNIILGGTGTCLIEGRRCTLEKSSCLWLFPDQEHMLIEQSPDFSMWICLFKPEIIAKHKSYIQNGVLDAEKHEGIFNRNLNRHDLQMLHQLCQRMSDGEDSYRFNQGIDWLFLETWKLFEESTLQTDLPHVPESIEQAVKLLQEADYSLPELAERCHVSSAWLSRSFKKHLGMNMSAFRNQQRIERFLHIYGTGHRFNMTEAAFAAGFNSYAQFYKVCCDICGKTPREIARSRKNL